MESLLDASDGGPQCFSIGELQQRFRQLLDSKVSPKRAEHVSLSVEFPSSVIFDLRLSAAENEVLSKAATADPALHGASQGQPLDGGEFSYQVHAHLALANQLQDDPAIQRLVSKHIIFSFSQVDNSTWVLRSMSRGSQGWTLIYACQNSMQSWLRLHAKTSRPPVGESSGKDSHHAVNLSRVCRTILRVWPC